MRSWLSARWAWRMLLLHLLAIPVLAGVARAPAHLRQPITVGWLVFCLVYTTGATYLELKRLKKRRESEDAAAASARAAFEWRRAAFHRAIFGRLLEEARRSGVPVRLGIDGERDLAGVYVRVNGEPSHIALDRGHCHYLVLAHEIGHHVAIQRRGDRSEEGADREGFRLIRSLLHDDERPFWESFINSIEGDLRRRRAKT